MALTISEKWIRERVHLDPENLADVRSLALPGTYHEKITHLGSALQNFSRLKHLDLSRNALQSLDGLQILSVLEKLNIYYNNISTLKDLYALRHNSDLQEIDLRLNPVTKNEPDYRLFMVHMLPNLRKLDDRSVRESEREAALMHFSSDQAADLTEHAPVPRRASTDRVINPRVEMVSNIPRTTTVLDDDDCDVLDLIARSGGDLGRPREITGSTAKAPQATTHTHPDRSGRSTPEGLTERERPERSNLPSTKYPPSPVAVAVAPPTDRHRGGGPWGDDRVSAREHELEGRMRGLEMSAGTEGSDQPSPNNRPLTSPKLKIPSLHVLTPSCSLNIETSPVVSLYRNMSSLKSAVKQSCLNDQHANTSHINNSCQELKQGSANADRALIISPSGTRRANNDYSGQKSQCYSNGVGSSETGSFSHQHVAVSLSPNNDDYALKKKIPLQQDLVQNGKDFQHDEKETSCKTDNVITSHGFEGMWEYGVRLGPPSLRKSPKIAQDILDQSTSGTSLSPSQDSTFSPDNIKPPKSPEHKIQNGGLKSNKGLSPNASSTNANHPHRRTNTKSVTFVISETDSKPQKISPNKPESYSSLTPKTVLKPSKNNRGVICQSPHVCAIISSPPEPKGTPTQPAGSYSQSKERVRVQFTNGSAEVPRNDVSRHFATSYSDETQAYTAYTSRGHFTPHPDENTDNRTAEPMQSRNPSHDYGSARPAGELTEASSDAPPAPTAGKRFDLNLFLDNFLSLVDRYWNGTKSLHRHGKFQSQAHTLLSTLTSEITASVAVQKPEVPRESTAEVTKLRQALRTSQEQGERLKGELDKALAEKRNFQQGLEAGQHEERSSDSQNDRGFRSGVMEREMENLLRENEGLKLHVKHFNQLQELATMLQESHKSLVTTNDHLLQELDETKQRHLEEVKQLHWSYGELKRTMDLMPGKHGIRPMDHLQANGLQ